MKLFIQNYIQVPLKCFTISVIRNSNLLWNKVKVSANHNNSKDDKLLFILSEFLYICKITEIGLQIVVQNLAVVELAIITKRTIYLIENTAGNIFIAFLQNP